MNLYRYVIENGDILYYKKNNDLKKKGECRFVGFTHDGLFVFQSIPSTSNKRDSRVVIYNEEETQKNLSFEEPEEDEVEDDGIKIDLKVGDMYYRAHTKGSDGPFCFIGEDKKTKTLMFKELDMDSCDCIWDVAKKDFTQNMIKEKPTS